MINSIVFTILIHLTDWLVFERIRKPESETPGGLGHLSRMARPAVVRQRNARSVSVATLSTGMRVSIENEPNETGTLENVGSSEHPGAIPKNPWRAPGKKVQPARMYNGEWKKFQPAGCEAALLLLTAWRG
jgi:hypothetical protein